VALNGKYFKQIADARILKMKKKRKKKEKKTATITKI